MKFPKIQTKWIYFMNLNKKVVCINDGELIDRNNFDKNKKDHYLNYGKIYEVIKEDNDQYYFYFEGEKNIGKFKERFITEKEWIAKQFNNKLETIINES